MYLVVFFGNVFIPSLVYDVNSALASMALYLLWRDRRSTTERKQFIMGGIFYGSLSFVYLSKEPDFAHRRACRTGPHVPRERQWHNLCHPCVGHGWDEGNWTSLTESQELNVYSFGVAQSYIGGVGKVRWLVHAVFLIPPLVRFSVSNPSRRYGKSSYRSIWCTPRQGV